MGLPIVLTLTFTGWCVKMEYVHIILIVCFHVLYITFTVFAVLAKGHAESSKWLCWAIMCLIQASLIGQWYE